MDGSHETEFSTAEHELLNDDTDLLTSVDTSLPDEARAVYDVVARKGVCMQAQ